MVFLSDHGDLVRSRAITAIVNINRSSGKSTAFNELRFQPQGAG
jgi:hypothetical protein